MIEANTQQIEPAERTVSTGTQHAEARALAAVASLANWTAMARGALVAVWLEASSHAVEEQ